MNKTLVPLLLLGCVLSTTVTGCAGLLAAGAATGIAVAHDRRTAGQVIEDQEIEFKGAQAIRDDSDLSSQSHISVTCYNGIVLLTGETPTEALRAKATDLVQNIPHVRRVHNEITIAAPSSMMSRSSDTLITAKVKTSLFHIQGYPGFDPTRVKVVTENGTVYLMGLLKHDEATAVTNEVRQVGGVQRVVKLFEYID